ncbi:hypothetical protein B0H19DRAFT_1098138 [Mycena capillaripes]|nr:hypothetical protein B0H19DRAFT_1098138 [Mycena capillaripes]
MRVSVWVPMTTLLSLPTASRAIINIATCQNTIAAALIQDPTLAYNTTVFVDTPASAQSGSLTLTGCEMYCAPGEPRMNPDCGNRLIQWLLPALFLVVSIAAPPVGWTYQVWTSLRPLADPFDAILSVSHRLSLCERCYRDAGMLVEELRRREERKRIPDTEKTPQPLIEIKDISVDMPRLQTSIALILYTFPTMVPHLSSKGTVFGFISSSTLPAPTLVSQIHHTAGRLAEDRARGVGQAWFTSASCIASLVLATVPALGGSSPSGAMVAAALLLSPLARDVLLGHAVGEAGSHYRTWAVLTDFVNACYSADGGGAKVKALRTALVRAGSEDEMETLAFMAGTSWYQPRRTSPTEREGARTWTHTAAVVLLLADTLASFAAAAGALAAPPSYLNARHLLMFGILGGWILSAWTTTFLTRSHSLTTTKSFVRLGRLVAAKDMLLALAIPVLFSATTCGWLSSCRLWSNYYGRGGRRVPLDNSAAFAWNDGVLYPVLVCTSLGLNVCTYLVLRWVVYRKAFGVLVWSERAIWEALWEGRAGS